MQKSQKVNLSEKSSGTDAWYIFNPSYKKKLVGVMLRLIQTNKTPKSIFRFYVDAVRAAFTPS